jgi:hypothetical protein
MRTFSGLPYDPDRLASARRQKMERPPNAEAVAHINKRSQFELRRDRILRIDGNRFGRPKKLEA